MPATSALKRYRKKLNYAPLDWVEDPEGMWVLAKDALVIEDQYTEAMKEIGRLKYQLALKSEEIQRLHSRSQTFSIP